MAFRNVIRSFRGFFYQFAGLIFDTYATDPTIPTGMIAIWYNSTSGTLKYQNAAGTVKTLLSTADVDFGEVGDVQNVGAVSAAGTSSEIARADHVHGLGAAAAAGTATAAGGTGATGGTAAVIDAITASGHVHYEAPIAPSANAGACALVVDVAVANGAQTIAAQPDFPRKLLLFITDGDSSISAGTLDLVGVGPSGEAVSESITLTGGTASKTSTKAYASITSATVANLAGATGADKIALGVAGALGLPANKTPAAGTFAVHKANVDNANETVGTVDATAGTIVPTTAPNGTRTFDFWFTFAMTPTSASHTHTGPSHTHAQV